MSVSFRIVEWNVDDFEGKLERAMEEGVRQAGNRLERHIIQKVSRPNPSGANPSRPGEPPKRVIGNLISSVFSEVQENGDMIWSDVGASAEYAKPLEFGTFRMAPRPFLRPSLSEMSRLMAQDVINALERA